MAFYRISWNTVSGYAFNLIGALPMSLFLLGLCCLAMAFKGQPIFQRCTMVDISYICLNQLLPKSCLLGIYSSLIIIESYDPLNLPVILSILPTPILPLNLQISLIVVC